eukprot:GILI01030175.1.p1 GENE.GILI01030175.1~~GILI01030175.1.p1  ORF type:complete len:183 (-),score=32.59 GILI01030175.1:178-726(-)
MSSVVLAVEGLPAANHFEKPVKITKNVSCVVSQDSCESSLADDGQVYCEQTVAADCAVSAPSASSWLSTIARHYNYSQSRSSYSFSASNPLPRSVVPSSSTSLVIRGDAHIAFEMLKRAAQHSNQKAIIPISRQRNIILPLRPRRRTSLECGRNLLQASLEEMSLREALVTVDQILRRVHML